VGSVGIGVFQVRVVSRGIRALLSSDIFYRLDRQKTMNTEEWAVFGVAGYLTMGLVTAYCYWRFDKEVLVETLGWVLFITLFWPFFAFFGIAALVISRPLPTYEELQERRREARERRQQPSEACPAGKEKR